jgi:hypothetical protein
MVRSAILLLASLLLVQHAAASSVSTVSSTGCSGSLSISLLDSAVFSCSGDFALSGGTISSDLSIFITSGGALTLSDIFISAPTIALGSSGGNLSVGSGAALSGNSISIWSNIGLAISTDATITVGSGAASRVISPSDFAVTIGSGTLTYETPLPTPVPLPGALLPMLFGLFAVFGVARTGSTKACLVGVAGLTQRT